MATLLPLFRHAVRPRSAAADGELLGRFAAGRDEEAFAELVRRHGPVVYRVCRRLVGPDAAEDAFQATFLVLATRLDAARAADAVGGWLVGVAGRVARQMRRVAGRRARHEAAAAGTRPTDRGSDPPDLTDQFRVLDEEIARLPDRLRGPVVLCLLQGRTQDQAAAELGRDARTLRRRLGRAKQVLRARLERRGVVPAVAAALVAGGGTTAAAVSFDLAARTVATVFDFLTGGTGAARPAPVVLAEGVATTMLARKATYLMAVVSAGLIGVGALLAGDQGAVPAPLKAPPAAAARSATAPPPAPVPTASLRAGGDRSRGQGATRPAEEELSVRVEGRRVQVPAGFLERTGVSDGPAEATWALSSREVRMLTALLQAEPKAQTFTWPRFTLDDNQTGFTQVGPNVPRLTAQLLSKAGDKAAAPPEPQPGGMTLRVTPRVSADKTHVQLHVEAQTTTAAGPVAVGNGLTIPAINTQTHTTTAVVPDTGTLVVRGATTSDGQEPREQFWLLTVSIWR